jgi:branched-chain amino acid transport system substrate-binding protein
LYEFCLWECASASQFEPGAEKQGAPARSAKGLAKPYQRLGKHLYGRVFAVHAPLPRSSPILRFCDEYRAAGAATDVDLHVRAQFCDALTGEGHESGGAGLVYFAPSFQKFNDQGGCNCRMRCYGSAHFGRLDMVRVFSAAASKLRSAALLSSFILGGAFLAQGAAAADLKIALIYGKTGPLEAYAKQTETGLRLGLEYATGGKMEIDGRKITIITKDDQGKPDLAKSLLAEAYEDDGVDLAIGTTSSAAALAMLPVAEEHKKILIVEPAVADDITGSKWNRYIFRSARNSSQDAVSNAVAIGKPGVYVATLGQDYAFGRDGVAAFKEALAKTGATLVHEEFAPVATTDFTAPAQRIFDALKDKPGRKIIWIIWAGGNPLTKIQDMDPKRYGIEISTGGNILPALVLYKTMPGMEGSTYYYYDIPKNPVNDWLVSEHKKRFNAPPDFFTCGGFSAAMAAVKGITTAKSTDTEKLIAAMEGMTFETPKGEMIFRKEDHQALQSMYHFKIKVDPSVPWAIPELVNELKISDMDIPIRNKK